MSDVEELEREIAALRLQLEDKQSALNALRSATNGVQQSVTIDSKQKLNNEEIGRYARQIILPEVGVKGQLALKNASILIVGAGGLGMCAHFKHSSFQAIIFTVTSCSLFRLSVGTVFVRRRCRSHWHR